MTLPVRALNVGAEGKGFQVVRRLLRSRIVIAVVSATLAATLVGGGAAAHIPASNGVISGCFKVVGGAFRVVNAENGKTCTADEKPLSWSAIQTGS